MWYMAENEMFICLVLYMSSDAFSGQHNSCHHESSEQRLQDKEHHGKNMILYIYSVSKVQIFTKLYKTADIQ